MMISLNTDKAVDKTECLFMGEKRERFNKLEIKGNFFNLKNHLQSHQQLALYLTVRTECLSIRSRTGKGFSQHF